MSLRTALRTRSATYRAVSASASEATHAGPPAGGAVALRGLPYRPRTRPSLRALAARAPRPELAALVLLAGALNLWALSRNGFANEYYSAAVRSMSSSWHNFLFASADPHAQGLAGRDERGGQGVSRGFAARRSLQRDRRWRGGR